ncbi:MAG: hypothetical protein MZW92_67140 [Comamonadaceae bacterium]|nr:hypothetical protein [Comamonadaceae bacterium]
MTDAFRVTSLDKPREYSMGTLAATSVQGAKVEADTVHWTFGLEAYERGWKGQTELAGMAYAPQYSIPDVVTGSLGGFIDFRTWPAAGLSLAAGARFDVAKSRADPLLANTDLYYAYKCDAVPVQKRRLPPGTSSSPGAIATGLDLGLGIGHTVLHPRRPRTLLRPEAAWNGWVRNPDLDVSRNSGVNASLSYRTGDLPGRATRSTTTSAISSRSSTRTRSTRSPGS